MSVEATHWALHVPVGGNAKVVLLGIANHAHPNGKEAYPSLDTLAGYAHCDRSTARRNVRKLVAEGWAIEDGVGPKGQTKYKLPLDRATRTDGKTPPRGKTARVAAIQPLEDKTSLEGVAPVPPEPSLEPSKEPSERTHAWEKPISYQGKKTPVSTVKAAVHLLEAFNEAAGRRFAPLDGQGKASKHLKQIIGGLIANPEATIEEWEFGLRRAIDNPPSWTDGRAIQLGDIFGERASAHALAPPVVNGNGHRNGRNGNGYGGRETNGDLMRAVREAKAQQNGNGPAPLALPAGEVWA